MLADLVRSLPLGKHMLRVDDYDLGKSPIKMANTSHFRVDGGWASLIVNGADSWTKAKLGGYETLDLDATDVDKVKRIAPLKD